jgi:hypothetical protein
MEDPCVLANRNSLVWKDIQGSIKFDYYRRFPASNTKRFYLWASIGQGSTEQAFLPCDTSGNVCVTKFFLLDQKASLTAQISVQSQEGLDKGIPKCCCGHQDGPLEDYLGLSGQDVRVV